MDESQNSPTVIYRSFQWQDSLALREVLRGAWDLQDYSANPAVMTVLLQHYLCTYLSQQNYTSVAVADGKPVGFLFGRCERTYRRADTWRYRVTQAVLSAALSCVSSGRAYLRNAAQIAQADRDLMTGRHFDSELVLFAVRSDFRGHGIGRRLQDDFRAHLDAMGAKSMFLYTDEFSNVGFYRAHGYEQVGETAVTFPDNPRPAAFYLFTCPQKRRAQGGRAATGE